MTDLGNRADRRRARATRLGYVRTTPQGYQHLLVPTHLIDAMRHMLNGASSHDDLDNHLGYQTHFLHTAVWQAYRVGIITKLQRKRLLRINQTANTAKHTRGKAASARGKQVLPMTESKQRIALAELVSAPIDVFTLHGKFFNLLHGNEEDGSDADLHGNFDKFSRNGAAFNSFFEGKTDSEDLHDNFDKFSRNGSGLAAARLSGSASSGSPIESEVEVLEKTDDCLADDSFASVRTGLGESRPADNDQFLCRSGCSYFDADLFVGPSSDKEMHVENLHYDKDSFEDKLDEKLMVNGRFSKAWADVGSSDGSCSEDLDFEQPCGADPLYLGKGLHELHDALHFNGDGNEELSMHGKLSQARWELRDGIWTKVDDLFTEDVGENLQELGEIVSSHVPWHVVHDLNGTQDVTEDVGESLQELGGIASLHVPLHVVHDLDGSQEFTEDVDENLQEIEEMTAMHDPDILHEGQVVIDDEKTIPVFRPCGSNEGVEALAEDSAPVATADNGTAIDPGCAFEPVVPFFVPCEMVAASIYEAISKTSARHILDIAYCRAACHDQVQLADSWKGQASGWEMWRAGFLSSFRSHLQDLRDEHKLQIEENIKQQREEKRLLVDRLLEITHFFGMHELHSALGHIGDTPAHILVGNVLAELREGHAELKKQSLQLKSMQAECDVHTTAKQKLKEQVDRLQCLNGTLAAQIKQHRDEDVFCSYCHTQFLHDDCLLSNRKHVQSHEDSNASLQSHDLDLHDSSDFLHDDSLLHDCSSELQGLKFLHDYSEDGGHTGIAPGWDHARCEAQVGGHAGNVVGGHTGITGGHTGITGGRFSKKQRQRNRRKKLPTTSNSTEEKSSSELNLFYEINSNGQGKRFTEPVDVSPTADCFANAEAIVM